MKYEKNKNAKDELEDKKEAVEYLFIIFMLITWLFVFASIMATIIGKPYYWGFLISAGPPGAAMMWTIRKSPGKKRLLKILKSDKNPPFGIQLIFNLTFILFAFTLGLLFL